MINFNNPKTKRTIAGMISGLLALIMVLSLIVAAF